MSKNKNSNRYFDTAFTELYQTPAPQHKQGPVTHHHCDHKPNPVKCGDVQIYASGRRFLKIPTDLHPFQFVVPLGSEFSLQTLIGYTGFLLPFPIQDFTAPDPQHLRIMAERMLTFAKHGNKVLTYCEGSHGRTGLVVATCIGLAEPDCEDPVEAVRKRHCHKACETDAQIRAVFTALDRPLPAKYAQGQGGSKQWQGFSHNELTAWSSTMNSASLPRVSTPPPAPKPIVAPLPSIKFEAPLQTPEPRHTQPAEGLATGGAATLDDAPFEFATDWPTGQRRRLLDPLIKHPTSRHWLHLTRGVQCVVCFRFEVDPTRLTISECTHEQVLPHHLDCDENAAKSAPVLTARRIAHLATVQPELWAIYRDKRKHRRKRRRQRGQN